MALLNKTLSLIILLLFISSASALTEVASNKPAWANSSGIGVFPYDGNDRNLGTAWQPSGSVSGYWGINLNHSYLIDSVNFSAAGNFVTDLYINGSTDNSTWTSLHHNAAFNLNNVSSIAINANYRYLNISMNGALASIVEFYVYTSTPSLISPTNGSSQTMTFPPLTTSVNFTWTADTSGLSSNLVVAKDINFNLIEADITTSNNYSSQSLEAGTHYWKVRYYNTTTSTYGNYSSYFYFTITSTSSATGTGIDGIIYELIGGVQTPISGVQVYISNNTYTDSMITGSNGYYLFNNLANNSTYSLIAKTIGYDDSQTEYVTTGVGTITTKDIRMNKCKSSFTCNYDSRFTKFIVVSLFGTRYSGVTVDAYKGSDVVPTLTGTTGNDGDVTFFVVKDQSYRMTFTSVSQGISLTRTITPGEEPEYFIIVTPETLTWWTNNSHTEVGTIDFVVSTYQINSTAAYVNFTYNDSLVQTTAWTVYLNQSNHTNVTWPQITVQSLSGANNNTSSFLISPYKGQSFLVNLVATHTTFGTVQRNFGVNFPGLAGGQLDFITDFFKALIAIAIIIFAGAMFDYPSRNQGAGVVCALGWVFLSIGFFNYFNTIAIIAGLSIATVFVIFMNMNERARQEDIS